MSDPRHGFLWTFVVCLLISVACALSREKSRGIAPDALKYYESDTIWCKDRSKSFPASRLNDNYCDCADGTDEPGTSACPEGKFYCKNVGHTPQFLFSSRVNDGICDCCDGSDEYNSKTVCPNTCWETGKKNREKLENKLSVFTEGSRIRAENIKAAKERKKKEETELAKLKVEESSLKEVTRKLKAQVEAIEKAEKLEREKKAKEEEERRRAEAALNETKAAEAAKAEEERVKEVHATEQQTESDKDAIPQSTNDEKTEPKENVDVHENVDPQSTNDEKTEPKENVDVHENVDPQSTNDEKDQELPLEKVRQEDVKEPAEEVHQEDVEEPADASEDPENMEGLSKEELGRRVASRWTRDTGTSEQDAINDEDDEDDKEESFYSPEPEEDEDGADSDVFDNDNFGPPELSDPLEDQEVPWWQRIIQAFQALHKFMGLRRMRVDLSEAERIRTDHQQSNSRLRELQSKISELEKKLKQDFGKDLEFYTLYDQCYERKQQKYVYKVCVYKQATQEEGHSSTRLGNWEGFEDDHRTIKFENGEHCWNGPQRSLRLTLICGLKSELSDIEEPSRCEYTASLRTPAVCFEHRARELKAELDAMRAAVSSTEHDEL